MGDHLYVSAATEPCAHRLVELAEAEECAVSGVQPTRESLLPRYGTVGGRRVAGRSDLYRVETVIEKPTPTEAEQRLMVPGLRAGYYLCFFGIHVLTPAVMDLLGSSSRRRPDALSAALAELARHEQYLALEDAGRRYDLGARYGLLTAQLALALDGQRPRAGARAAASNCWPIANRARPRERTPVSRAHRDHHGERSGNAQPLARCRSAATPRSTNCSPSAQALDRFRRSSDNLYERVRALFFLYAIHRFHLPLRPGAAHAARSIPFAGYANLLKRRFEEAIDHLPGRAGSRRAPAPPSPARWPRAIARSASRRWPTRCAAACARVRGNQWMFRTGHPGRLSAAHPPRTAAAGAARLFPILREATPVRMDLTHSGWSDIFFLGMDFPEGARVLNISIDLGVRGAGDGAPRPPVEAYFRVIDEPVLRLASVDLQRHAPTITTIAEVFDFARDYLGLLKAAVIASGIVPPGMEGAAPAAGRPAGAPDRTAGPRHRDRQQGQRHSQRLAPGRLHQPAGLPDRGVHARHRPDPRAHRRAWRSTTAGWWPRAPSWANGWAAPAAAGRIPAASGPASS